MTDLWTAIEQGTLQPEGPLLRDLIARADLGPEARKGIADRAADLVRRIRADVRPGLMEVFLAEYGLSTHEGIALMCLAEALLRVPDPGTMDALIEDKIAASDWGRHAGQSTSPLVNASTWALMLTGKVLEDREPGVVGHLRAAVRRLGEPVIRAAVTRAMKEMGRQFVLGETIGAAMDRAASREARGFSYSYDMLGEAAKTAADARRYADAYASAITAIGAACRSDDIRDNPGISVKLSALHPRYEVAQEARVMAELVPVVRNLARAAARARMGFNIDAEEADRLTLSLKVIAAVLADPELAGWDGFGVVVQAYGRRAGAVLDWLHDLTLRLDRKIMVRLVKGAYWDSEIKRAQVLGLAGYPVFTRKEATDTSYIANARRLFAMTDRIYPQFATHNAHTVAAILHMAGGRPFEFQRLHGMGERLHDIVMADAGHRCRIYAPVGAHRDLLAYLVRRLLENGANSSFVHLIVNTDVPPETVVRCPLTDTEATLSHAENPRIPLPAALFRPRRGNSAGFDLTDAPTLARIAAARDFAAPSPTAGAMLAGAQSPSAPRSVLNPATGAPVGQVAEATPADVAAALSAASPWDAPPAERTLVLDRAAALLEQDFGPIFALLSREAGKNLPDAVSELREAADFLRYYAGGIAALDCPPLGTVVAISPWNFPLAIFTGQIAAALAAGNAVIAKPAEQTPLIAAHAVALLHRAGVPRTALQLLPGDGATIGGALTADPRVRGVIFTGSTDTARVIRRAMAANLTPGTPFIAETGGINAMIVDSTALPEQAVRDIVSSAFQSAGQRCSALRCLYVQDDLAPHLVEMLLGAMDELAQGDPWSLATDIGPVIDAEAAAGIAAHVARARAEGRLIKELPARQGGHFIGPAVIRVNAIGDIDREVFGPVLHLATFPAEALGRVIAEINATGYGLTFGLHSRIDARVQEISDSIAAGNIYVNRNQIGAVVGSQPFGGEGLSGTGPKAGGPGYLARLTLPLPPQTTPAGAGAATQDLPGPTGESNRLRLVLRAPVLCLGPGTEARTLQARAIRGLGGRAIVPDHDVTPKELSGWPGISGAIFWGDPGAARDLECALAERAGPILPLITAAPDLMHAFHERHVCVDTTASGGNAALLSEAG